MSTTLKTKRKLHPAYGDLELAVVLMAGRYADSYASWITAIHRRTDFDRDALQRRQERQHRAFRRLVAALAQQHGR